MSSSKSNKSIIFYNGFREKSYCGYCKKDKSSYSHGMWASSLTVQAYQDLIDRGWRRSGKYCYKPTMDKSCCPLYTIRCDALDFQLSKSQKKIIKKVSRFLKSGKQEQNIWNSEEAQREPQEKFDSYDMHDIDKKMEVVDSNNSSIEELNTPKKDLQNCASTTNSCETTNIEKNDEVLTKSLDDVNQQSKMIKEKKTIKPGKGADPNLPKCKKKKLLRIEKKLAKNPNAVITTLTPQQKTVEDFIAENDTVSEEQVYNLKIKLLRLTPSASSFESEYAVYKLYQTCVHGDTDDQCTRQQFIRFLVDSPLKFENTDVADHPGYGSFHQQYWLGNKLIAVGVIDILPKCVSSVYLFYDPDYYHLVLGTYSSLREICLVRQLHKMSPDLKYYYMGFYINSCPKMRYKAHIKPSYLLCPLQYTWHNTEICIPKLDKAKYVVFNDTDKEEDGSRVEDVPMLYCGKLMTHSVYKRITKVDIQDQLLEYIKLVGPNLAKLLIYCVLD
ncbi:arginyl-tRNA--protein transferase 1 isoform X2 [Adelges cooleyi]|uniref:arginyl-tRNA--protein transferase 1 isoform X2 n=1 Tax=Adelges cooleyi TaxID=133065 RepID=UPI00217FC65D|nr:arginyl-tRNA--protein transferase 1 isoform X2 [Adelges cooleyi]